MGEISTQRWLQLLHGKGPSPSPKEQEALDSVKDSFQELEDATYRRDCEKMDKVVLLEKQRKSRNGRRNIRQKLMRSH